MDCACLARVCKICNLFGAVALESGSCSGFVKSRTGENVDSSTLEDMCADTHASDTLQSQFKVNLCDHDIKVGKILGRGSFAQVYQGLWNDTAVAIKVIEYNSGARDAVDPLLEASLSRCGTFS